MRVKINAKTEKMMRFIGALPAALIVLSYLSSYSNQNLAEAQYFTGPVSSAMGGAGAAAVNASEGAFLNPAVLAHGPKFESHLVYKDGYYAEKSSFKLKPKR